MLVHRRFTPSVIHQYHLTHQSGGRIVSCLALKHNTSLTPSTARTWATWSRVLFTNQLLGHHTSHFLWNEKFSFICFLWYCCTAVIISQTVEFTSSLFSARMDYLECNFGPSCTCDHRSTLVHGTTPSFSSPDSRGCDVMTRSSQYSKKELSDSMIPKRARSEGSLISWIWQSSFHCLVIRKSLKFCLIIISRDAAHRRFLAKFPIWKIAHRRLTFH